MTTLIADHTLAPRFLPRTALTPIADEAELHCGVGEACLRAVPMIRAGARPGASAPLEHFVSAHAQARGVRDSTAFRRALSASSSAEREPELRRYWRLLGAVTGEPVTVGTAICWLADSLDLTLSAPV